MGVADDVYILWTLLPQYRGNHETATPVEDWASQAVVVDVDCELDVLKPYNYHTIYIP